ncbi:hypothetical protein NGI08_00985 [Klebsiella michiganensis]|uniref:hypothetical protein n=1 Tax=Klebsiella michiganensis TaxID=1134687 RepID=UPI002DBBC15C|nr:hypothetical protein [Klebsiella michiganensis]MEB8077381.1 hypothetical protein [Klebsiella michiganensis]
MFQFKELIKTGMGEANRVEKNRESVDKVFSSLNSELADETDGLFTIERYIQKPSAFAEIAKTYAIINQSAPPLVSLDSKGSTGTLKIVLSSGGNASIARWEQDPDGYPFTIEFMGERTDCWDQEGLVNALGKIVVSGQLWLKVKELQSKALKASEQNNTKKND